MLGEEINEHLKLKFLPLMEAHERITAYAGVTYSEITPEGMVVTTQEGQQKTLTADTVMIIEKPKKTMISMMP